MVTCKRAALLWTSWPSTCLRNTYLNSNPLRRPDDRCSTILASEAMPGMEVGILEPASSKKECMHPRDEALDGEVPRLLRGLSAAQGHTEVVRLLLTVRADVEKAPPIRGSMQRLSAFLGQGYMTGGTRVWSLVLWFSFRSWSEISVYSCTASRYCIGVLTGSIQGASAFGS